jgi:hypothetical protein
MSFIVSWARTRASPPGGRAGQRAVMGTATGIASEKHIEELLFLFSVELYHNGEHGSLAMRGR